VKEKEMGIWEWELLWFGGRGKEKEEKTENPTPLILRGPMWRTSTKLTLEESKL
jgi:hypothetical protein